MSDNLEKILKEVDKQYGKGVAINANDLLDEEKHVIPLSPALNLGLHGGIPEGSWITCSGHPKSGKEQPVSAIVYTANGPKRIGDITYGEMVCCPNGTISMVCGIYPQGVKDVYTVTFSDGSTAECGENHLWNIKTREQESYKTVMLKDFMNKIYIGKGTKAKYSIPITAPVKFNQIKIPINPFVFGALLTVGFFNKKITALIENEKLLDRICSLMNGTGISYTKEEKQLTINVHDELKELGLFGKKTSKKFIPPNYLYNSVENRMSLLQGILSFAHITKTETPILTISSKQFAEDFRLLVQSLGGICLISRHKNNEENFIYYCSVIIKNKKKLLEFKKEKFKKKDVKNNISRKIISVVKTRREQSVCISVRDKSGLYLTDNFVVTHNTLTSLSFAAQCQKPENGSRHVYYLNIEGRLKPMNLRGIAGLDLNKMTIYRSTQEKILTAKDYLNLAFKAINTHPGSLIIIDSVSALCDEKEMDQGIGYENRGAGNKLFAGFCRQAANIVPVQNCMVWAIMHLTQSQGMYGGYTEKGSRTLQYQADVQMRVKSDKPWTVGGEGKDKQIGQQVHWLIESCSLGSPGMEVDSYIRYGIGIDNTYEAINLGCQLGLINKAGAWMTLDFMERHLKLLKSEAWDDVTIKLVKTQGAEKMYKLLLENPKWIVALEKEIKAIIS